MDNLIALCVPVIKQLRHIAAFPDDADRSLAAHRATLLQEPLEEIERPGCVLGGEYYPGRDIGMIASSLNLVQIRRNQFPVSSLL